MTLPALLQKRTNLEVEAKLKKYYSIMNQAILLSEADNGSKDYWNNSLNAENFLNKYIIPYIHDVAITKFKNYGGDNIAIYMSDGTAMVIKKSGTYDFFFFPNAKNLDKSTFGAVDNETEKINREDLGITYFAFLFAPGSTFPDYKYNKKSFEPNKNNANELTAEVFRQKCNKNDRIWCTALIQFNNWKIPKDYPFQVK